MTTLILHRGNLPDLAQLLTAFDDAANAIVIASADKISTPCQALIPSIHAQVQALHLISQYDQSNALEQIVYEISQTQRITQVFAMAEFDLYRAERLKSWLNLPFIPEKTLRIFRNKIAMKDYFRAAGLATPHYAEVKSILDVYDFAEKYGYPLVIKQQEGAGGVGARVLRSEKDIAQFALATFRPNGFTEPSLMVETFAQGKLHHVDGVVYNQTILYLTCSVYINAAIEDFEQGKSAGSVLLPNNSPIYQILSAHQHRLIASSPISVPYTFHAEYFVTEDQQVQLCEVACRTGGAAINTANALLRGVDLNAWLINSLFHHQALPIEPKNTDLSGGLIVSAQGLNKQRANQIPERCPLPFVLDYQPKVSAGEVFSPAISNIQGLFSAVFSAETAAQGAQHYQTLLDWQQETFILEVLN
jgi:biotin carboxylase